MKKKNKKHKVKKKYAMSSETFLLVLDISDLYTSEIEDISMSMRFSKNSLIYVVKVIAL